MKLVLGGKDLEMLENEGLCIQVEGFPGRFEGGHQVLVDIQGGVLHVSSFKGVMVKQMSIQKVEK